MDPNPPQPTTQPSVGPPPAITTQPAPQPPIPSIAPTPYVNPSPPPLSTLSSPSTTSSTSSSPPPLSTSSSTSPITSSDLPFTLKSRTPPLFTDKAQRWSSISAVPDGGPGGGDESPDASENSHGSMDWKLLGFLIFLYFCVFVYFAYVADNIRRHTPFVQIMQIFIVGTILLWVIYAIYRLQPKLRNTSLRKVFLTDIAFLIGNVIFITLVWALTTNVTGKGSKLSVMMRFGILGLILFPLIWNQFFPSESKNKTPITIGQIYWNFFTSSSFLFTMIICALLLLYTNVQWLNMPNIATWQQWSMIASLVFGIKYFLLYRFSYSSPMTIFGFLALMSFLVFLLIQPPGINKNLLTVVFSLACMLFAIMLPIDIPFLTQLFLMVSIFLSIGLGLITQTFSSSTVSILFGICSLYLVIHAVNSLSNNLSKFSSKDPENKGFELATNVVNILDSNLNKTFLLYAIILAVVLVLYFTDEGNTKSIPTQWGWISFPILVPFCIYVGLRYYFSQKPKTPSSLSDFLFLTKKENNISEGIWIGGLFNLVGLLILTIYLLSKHYNTHINYSIVAMILMYVVGSLLLMAYNLKDSLHMLLALVYVLFPIVFIWMFQHKEGDPIFTRGWFIFIAVILLILLAVLNLLFGKSADLKLPMLLFFVFILFPMVFIWFFQLKKGWFIFLGVILLLLWCLANLLFWKSSELTFNALFNTDALILTISGLILYLLFYYVYVTLTSKSSISQRFSQIVLIIMFSYLLLQIFKTTKIASNPFLAFLISLLEYIPCLIDDIITRFLQRSPEGGESWKEDFSYHSLGTKILAFLVLVMVGYYAYPKIRGLYVQNTNTPGVILVGETPISTQGLTLIQTYQELTNKITAPIYNYGISFDLYINPVAGTDTFYNVINFTGNLFVQYNTQQNQLYIFALKDEENTPAVTLYRYTQFPLQKWVKVSINYVGGIYDVFIENKLKTTHSLVSYNSHENIFVGSQGSSVVGQVKNFMFYPKPISTK